MGSSRSPATGYQKHLRLPWWLQGFLPESLYLLQTPSVAAVTRPCSSLLFFQVWAGAGYHIRLFSERGWLLPAEQSSLRRLFQAGSCCCSWSGNGTGKISFSFFYKSLRVRSLFWRDGELPWRDPLGSAPACPTDHPQHQFGRYSGCHNDFFRDNDLFG